MRETPQVEAIIAAILISGDNMAMQIAAVTQGLQIPATEARIRRQNILAVARARELLDLADVYPLPPPL